MIWTSSNWQGTHAHHPRSPLPDSRTSLSTFLRILRYPSLTAFAHPRSAPPTYAEDQSLISNYDFASIETPSTDIGPFGIYTERISSDLTGVHICHSVKFRMFALKTIEGNKAPLGCTARNTSWIG